MREIRLASHLSPASRLPAAVYLLKKEALTLLLALACLLFFSAALGRLVRQQGVVVRCPLSSIVATQ